MPKRPLLEINNVWTKIIYPSDLLYEVLDGLESTLKNTGIGIYNKSYDLFMSGLAPYVIKRSKAGFIDRRVKPIGKPKNLDSNFLRPHQFSAASAGIKHVRGILKLPTGAGKTRIAVNTMASLQAIKWLFCVHKANLVDAVAETFTKYTGEPAGRIHGNSSDWKDRRVVCATFDSLVARPEYAELIQDSTGVIVDEAHKLSTKSAISVLLYATNAYYRIGLGATPLIREDQRDIHTVALLGPQLYEVSVDTLVSAGHIVQPRIVWLDCQLPSVTGKRSSDYARIYDDLIACNQTRNDKILDTILIAEKPCIVFVTKHEHQRQLSSHGYVSVNEKTSIAERNEIVEKLKRGDLQTIVSTQVFTEGVDVPNLKTVINATACSSWIQTIQELGRGTRPFPGKKFFTVYDFNDIGQEWFEEHTAQRYVAYKAAGFEVDAPSRHAKKVLKAEQDRMNLFTELSEPEYLSL